MYCGVLSVAYAWPQILAWRIPVLKQYRYIVYHDSSLSARNPHMYRDAMQALRNTSYVHIAHPERITIAAEANASISQPRYLEDRVELQADHYLREWLYPDDVQLRLGTFAIYDAWDLKVQVLISYSHILTFLTMHRCPLTDTIIDTSINIHSQFFTKHHAPSPFQVVYDHCFADTLCCL
jgi:hypothetical protein